MFIAYTDTQSGRTLVANLASGVNPEQAAAVMNLTPGTWRMVTPEEAAQLQAPTPEELAGQRIAAIHSRFDELDRKSARPFRTALRALLEGEQANEKDIQRLLEIDAEAEALRTELAGLMPAQRPSSPEYPNA